METLDDLLAPDAGASAESLSPRERILRAAATLLAEGGREAVSTRAVSALAGVQPPTIYRQFGDMQGLLDEVASEGFKRYVRAKLARSRLDDPVADLRDAWDLHIRFGLANPALYALMYGAPRPGAESPAALEAHALLERMVRRVAEAGRLRVSVESATRMILAAGVGVVLTLIAEGSATPDRDLTVARLTHEAILAAVTTDAPPGATSATSAEGASRCAVGHAVALKAALPHAPVDFSLAERSLLTEWLDRLIQAAGG